MEVDEAKVFNMLWDAVVKNDNIKFNLPDATICRLKGDCEQKLKCQLKDELDKIIKQTKINKP